MFERMQQFEDEFKSLHQRQLAESRGQRREMLERDLSNTRTMLEVLYPVIRSLDDVVLEYEMIALSGIRIYGDAFLRSSGTVLEEENYITHAEQITRKRFSFERARTRSVTALGYAYYPYSRDELEQQPESCRRDLQALISMKLSGTGAGLLELPVVEREALRFAALRLKSFQLVELSDWLRMSKEASSRAARSLVAKGLLVRIGGGEHRCFEFAISDKGRAVMLG
ncbi:hypothetical protein COLU111180_06640 [Cohnella lubricantis]|uniref:Uncharacterized protein n=1 Tax=Cohnella lubricantis TaxID=2163172 RepID=A0A841TG51_9BACL|nr:hypothetical protein [Cohnella lubricantis]MBB6677441.1 hypothetical protein [Cohnella lubricantis]MBP2116673.1 hypothetical protein [Cohnella lubricantis]